jgi:peptide/nickel transport system substrate-binding protein
MIKTKRKIAIGVVGAMILLLSAGMFLFIDKESGEIIIGASTLPDSLNPVLEQNTAAINADELVFDGLVNFEVDPDTGKISTELAIAESIVQDPVTKKNYQVVLREMSWHDGRPLTADDVVFSYRAYAEPLNRSPKKEYLLSFIENVKAIDEKTVEIEFRRPIPPFRVYPVLTFKIIPSIYNGRRLSLNLRTGENERKFAVQPVGTGPFMLTSWEIGKWVGFTANLSYFRRMPASSSLVIRKVIDPVIRMNEFRKGRINLMLETSPMDRSRVEGLAGVDINWYFPYAFYQLAINTRSQRFSHIDSRAAISASLDRSSLVPSVTDQKNVVINYSPFPADMFPLNLGEYNIRPLENMRPYDIELAKKLAVSGGIAGTSVNLLYPDSLGEFGKRTAEGIASQLSAIGLSVEAKRTGDQVFRRLVFLEKNYDLALLYCDGFDNLYSGLASWYRSDGPSNIYGIRDVQLDRLFDVWSGTVVTADWVALTRLIHERITALVPAVYLYTIEKDVYSRGLKDVVIASDNPYLSAEHWSLGGI